MKVIIRVDSSRYIGSGHMMRCLTLAQELRVRGANISFICRDLPGNIADLADEQGFPVGWIEEGAWIEDAALTANVVTRQGTEVDWLVADHYQLDTQWETALRPYVKRIMVIDDLANRKHNCDLLLDANFYRNRERRYDRLVPPSANLLLGPSFSLLRQEFDDAVSIIRERSVEVKRVLVFFGGSDPTGETGKLLNALTYIDNRDFELDIVVGTANPRKDTIQKQCQAFSKVSFACQVNNMAERMAAADLAVGAGGTTIWERCYLGLPSIVVAVAENQIEVARTVAAAGAIAYLGYSDVVDAQMIAASIAKLNANASALQAMSKAAKALVPRNGTDLVVEKMLTWKADFQQ